MEIIETLLQELEQEDFKGGDELPESEGAEVVACVVRAQANESVLVDAAARGQVLGDDVRRLDGRQAEQVGDLPSDETPADRPERVADGDGA